MKSPEGFEKDDIKKFLKSLGPECWFFMPAMNGYGGSGVPDIVGCYRGSFFGIEVKREGKAPTPIQKRRMQDAREAGGHAFAGTAEVVIANFKIAFAL